MLGAAQADDQQLIDAVVRSGADIFLSRDAAGFDLPVGERGSRLSGGQRSLLVLARALVSPSKLLFLDEPTGAMDTQTELYFIEHLKTALAPGPDAGRRRPTATTCCRSVDRLIVIDAGKIIADGPRDEVLGQLQQRAAARRKQTHDRARHRPAPRRRDIGLMALAVAGGDCRRAVAAVAWCAAPSRRRAIGRPIAAGRGRGADRGDHRRAAGRNAGGRRAGRS